jgi:hypothetical protein
MNAAFGGGGAMTKNPRFSNIPTGCQADSAGPIPSLGTRETYDPPTADYHALRTPCRRHPIAAEPGAEANSGRYLNSAGYYSSSGMASRFETRPGGRAGKIYPRPPVPQKMNLGD